MNDLFTTTRFAKLWCMLPICVSGWSCTRPESPPEKEERLVREATAMLASEMNASASWEERLTGAERESFDCIELAFGEPPTYTVDVEGALVDESPIVFRATIVDIASLGSGYDLTFAYPDGDCTSVVFRLTATEERLEDILTNRARVPKTVVVAASVDRVSRPMFQVNASALNEYEAELWLDLQGPFVARGEMLRLQRVRQDDGKAGKQ